MSEERLSRADLEAFHDGALEGAERERVAERLREDPGARERLARVRDVDAMARGVLLGEAVDEAAMITARRESNAPICSAHRWHGGEGVRGVHRFARVGWGRSVWSTVAAVVVVMTGAGLAWWGLRGGGAGNVVEGDGAGAVAVAPVVTEGVDEVMRREGVVVMRMDAAPRARTETAHRSRDDGSVEARLVSLVGEGSLAEAFEAARSHPGAMSDEVMAVLGERVRSGELAREFLESLPADRQAQAVRVWAGNPHLRPAAFDRLRELLRSPDVGARSAGERVREDLALRPELATWVASYARMER